MIALCRRCRKPPFGVVFSFPPIRNKGNVKMSSETAIEAEIQAKGKTAPRITPDHIDSVIASEFYFTAGDAVDGAVRAGRAWISHREIDTEAGERHVSGRLDLLTFCVLVLKNGFTVTGESACASPENFDPEIGRKIARENARNKIWPLEGYLLRERLHSA